ncbi:MAG: hypothetical protein WC980_02690 [Candidatus Brocadiia bacterium]
MNNFDENDKSAMTEPELPKELEGMLKETFKRMSPPNTAALNCKMHIAGMPKPSESIWLYPIIYPAAAVVLSILSIFIMMNYMVSPDLARETSLVADKEITLTDGTILGIGKESSVKIEENNRTLVLEKGWLRVNCPTASGLPGQNKLRIIAPAGTIINKGDNFMAGYSSSSRTFSVWGSIELLTSK